MTLGGIWLKSQNEADTSALYQIKQTDLLYNSLGILAEVSLFVFATKTTVTVRRSDKINSLQNDRLNMNWQFLLPSLVFFAGLRLSKAFFGLALFGLAQTAEPLEVSCFNCSCTVQVIEKDGFTMQLSITKAGRKLTPSLIFKGEYRSLNNNWF